MSDSTVPTRPAGVTVVVVLVILVGLIDVIGGLLLILNRQTANISGLDASGAMVSGVIEILIGLFVVLVGRALSWGSNVARWLIIAFMALRIIAGVAGMVASPGITQDLVHASVIVLALVIIGLLFTARASEFFRAHKYG